MGHAHRVQLLAQRGHRHALQGKKAAGHRGRRLDMDRGPVEPPQQTRVARDLIQRVAQRTRPVGHADPTRQPLGRDDRHAGLYGHLLQHVGQCHVLRFVRERLIENRQIVECPARLVTGLCPCGPRNGQLRRQRQCQHNQGHPAPVTPVIPRAGHLSFRSPAEDTRRLKRQKRDKSCEIGPSGGVPPQAASSRRWRQPFSDRASGAIARLRWRRDFCSAALHGDGAAFSRRARRPASFRPSANFVMQVSP